LEKIKIAGNVKNCDAGYLTISLISLNSLKLIVRKLHLVFIATDIIFNMFLVQKIISEEKLVYRKLVYSSIAQYW
jgi:hypothetical protein